MKHLHRLLLTSVILNGLLSCQARTEELKAEITPLRSEPETTRANVRLRVKVILQQVKRGNYLRVYLLSEAPQLSFPVLQPFVTDSDDRVREVVVFVAGAVHNIKGHTDLKAQAIQALAKISTYPISGAAHQAIEVLFDRYWDDLPKHPQKLRKALIARLKNEPMDASAILMLSRLKRDEKLVALLNGLVPHWPRTNPITKNESMAIRGFPLPIDITLAEWNDREAVGRILRRLEGDAAEQVEPVLVLAKVINNKTILARFVELLKDKRQLHQIGFYSDPVPQWNRVCDYAYQALQYKGGVNRGADPTFAARYSDAVIAKAYTRFKAKFPAPRSR